MVLNSQCKCIFKDTSYLVELKERIKILINVALGCITKLTRKFQLKNQLAKKEEQTEEEEEEEEMEEEEWTEEEMMKIFMSVVKILQINFPLYKVHKMHFAVSWYYYYCFMFKNKISFRNCISSLKC